MHEGTQGGTRRRSRTSRANRTRRLLTWRAANRRASYWQDEWSSPTPSRSRSFSSPIGRSGGRKVRSSRDRSGGTSIRGTTGGAKRLRRTRPRREPQARTGDTRRLRRIILVAGGIVAVLLMALAIAGATSISTLKTAKDELTQAKDLLQGVADNPSALLKHAGRNSDLATLAQATRLADSAHRALVSSAGMGFMNLFPILHTQVSGTEQLASDAAQASKVATGLVRDVDALAAHASVSGGKVPLAPLSLLHEKVSLAAHQMAALNRHPGGLVGLIGPLGHARDIFDATASKVTTRLTNAADDLLAAQSFMGSGGPRTYLVMGENNDTMRDQGIFLSYATVSFDHGRFTHTPSGDTGTIEPNGSLNLPIPTGTEEAFGKFAPSSNWQSVNLTADFPWSASTMAAMYRQVAGAHVDGVIALDVPALSRILSVIGPVSVPGISTPLTSSNAAYLLLDKLYADAPGVNQQSERTDKVTAAISAVFSKLQGGNVADIVDLGDALAKSAAGGHLMLWSSHPAEEKAFQKTGISGNPSAFDPTRTVHVAVEDATGAKLDYFVKPSVKLAVSISAHGTAHVAATVTIANDAPSGPPSLQLGPDGYSQSKPGQLVGLVSFWGPSGDVQAGSVPESGLSLSQQDFTVDSGASRSLSFAFSIPHAVRSGHFNLRLVPQPWLNPENLTVSLTTPGWKITSGARDQGISWDKTLNLQWGLEKG